MMKKRTEEILVSEACFRQQVNLPVSQVAGLSDAELATALAFEIEPFSGIPQTEGEMAWRIRADVSSTRRIYDVVQIRKTDLAKILSAAKSEKKKVKGVTAQPDFSSGETLEEMPIVRPSKKKISFNLAAVWIGICVICFASVILEYVKISSENKTLKSECAAREILQSRKSSLESKEKSIRSEIENIRQSRESEKRAQNKTAALRSSWHILLEAVSAACADESVIQHIEKKDEPFKAVIKGVALSPEAASRTLRRLTDKLRSQKSAWTVSPGEIGSRSAGGTVSFSCEAVFDAGEEL